MLACTGGGTLHWILDIYVYIFMGIRIKGSKKSFLTGSTWLAASTYSL